MNVIRALRRVVRQVAFVSPKRRGGVGVVPVLLLCMLASGSPAHAAPVSRAPHRYLIAMVLWRGMTDAERGFLAYLKEHDVPFRLVRFNCKTDKHRLPGFIAKIKALHPDLVYTFGTTVTSAVAGREGSVNPKRNITHIPIVFNIVADPVGAGITNDMHSTDRNVTGVTHTVPLKIQLKTLMQLKTVHRLGVIYNPKEKNSVLAVQKLAKYQTVFHYTLLRAPVHIVARRSVAKTVGAAVHQLATKKPGLIYLPSDSYVIAHENIVTRDINRLGIPSFSATEGPVRDSGALMGLVTRYYNAGKFAGFKAWQILVEHHRPRQIPVQGLKHFTVVVNMRTAHQLNIYPPITLLSLAEIVGTNTGQSAHSEK